MSEVWLAKHEGLAVPVIVKTLRPSLLETQGAELAAARVRSEARLMARVSSPRIVRAIDAGVVPASGIPFLVQEYVTASISRSSIGAVALRSASGCRYGSCVT
jgi:serine/threonine-protein kinase